MYLQLEYLLIEDNKLYENVNRFKNLVQFLKLEGMSNFKD